MERGTDGADDKKKGAGAGGRGGGGREKDGEESIPALIYGGGGAMRYRPLNCSLRFQSLNTCDCNTAPKNVAFIYLLLLLVHSFLYVLFLFRSN